ncbi:HET-domain-containing protein [Apiospora kogelbergensis]|uniref:HET-domain-containing protein n=1 Tax=Apiospora kogelbergensis TaxID=1337665 RepID=A0AAW0QNL3_9PEZI
MVTPVTPSSISHPPQPAYDSTQCIAEVDFSVRQEVRYAALSYVWGRLPGVQESTRANLFRLKAPGALASSVLANALPKTMLCVIQDDVVSKPLHLSQMGAIYANSCLEVVVHEAGRFAVVNRNSSLAARLQRRRLGLGRFHFRFLHVAAEQLLALILSQVPKLLGQLRRLLRFHICFLDVAAEQLLALILSEVPKLLGNVPNLAARCDVCRLRFILAVDAECLDVALDGGVLDNNIAGCERIDELVETTGLDGGTGRQKGRGKHGSSQGCGHGESELHGG